VKPDAPPEHAFSHLHIDHTVSGFTVGSDKEKTVRLIYEHLMYESKPQPPCKEVPAAFRPGLRAGARGPFFTVREHDHKPPPQGSHKEVLIYGSTQLSKTPEAAASAWCAFFVDGCVPIVGVRNKGGANTGSVDMAKGIQKLNASIEALFLHELRAGNLGMLVESDCSAFYLHPRKTSDGEQMEFDPNSLKLARPQVLIMCMNPNQVKNLIGPANAASSKAGATSGLLDIMKGNTNHPYPPKCHDPYAAFDHGENRAVARIYFILDEDDLNRSNQSTAVTERLQFNAPKDVMDKINRGIDKINQAGAAARAAAAAAAGSVDDPVDLDTDDDAPLLDEEDDPPPPADGSEEAVNEERMRSEFRSTMDATGVRSAVRGVVALTATPAACGHDLSERASQVNHRISSMEHPANYVGYPFTAAPYAERTIVHMPVPDRKQIVAIAKTPLYIEVLKKHSWWDVAGNRPMEPFKKRADGAITVRKAELDEIEEGGGVSSAKIKRIVDEAARESKRRGDKVLESDGVGIALMLESMSEKPASAEPERRGLIISNYTRTEQQKLQLAKHILEGDLLLPPDEAGDARKLPQGCVCDLFVIIFDHKTLRIMWRGEAGGGAAGSSDDVVIQPDHDSLDLLNAIREGSPLLYNGCKGKDKRRGEDPCVEVDGTCKVFRSSFINVNHVYTCLLLYAYRRRQAGRPFKLKTVCLAGDLGGRGVNFKSHGDGFNHDPSRGTYTVEPHQGYLTDMFFMFDAVANRQITTHGEYVLQSIGRLCTLVNDADLAKMALTPPRFWTSNSCYSIIRTFALGVHQWVSVMQSKAAGESMTEAVVRSIRAEPGSYTELYMLYFLPTTDSRWAKKELWLRQSRLMGADRRMGEGVRAAPRMPPTPLGRTHGIEHNPEREAEVVRAGCIRKAEQREGERSQRGSDEEGVEGEAPAPSPAKRQRRRRVAPDPDAAEMRIRFEALYAQHQRFARTSTTPSQRMPGFDETIWTTWFATAPNERYKATVIDIVWNEDRSVHHRDDELLLGFLYTVRFETNDDHTIVPPGQAHHVEEFKHLELDMSDWSRSPPADAAAPMEE